jgi:hypothetical protein
MPLPSLAPFSRVFSLFVIGAALQFFVCRALSATAQLPVRKREMIDS